ncbi:hypothetical protein B9479_006291, partial [Cryptococcus floricola]
MVIRTNDDDDLGQLMYLIRYLTDWRQPDSEVRRWLTWREVREEDLVAGVVAFWCLRMMRGFFRIRTDSEIKHQFLHGLQGDDAPVGNKVRRYLEKTELGVEDVTLAKLVSQASDEMASWVEDRAAMQSYIRASVYGFLNTPAHERTKYFEAPKR